MEDGGADQCSYSAARAGGSQSANRSRHRTRSSDESNVIMNNYLVLSVIEICGCSTFKIIFGINICHVLQHASRPNTAFPPEKNGGYLYTKMGNFFFFQLIVQ